MLRLGQETWKSGAHKAFCLERPGLLRPRPHRFLRPPHDGSLQSCGNLQPIGTSGNCWRIRPHLPFNRPAAAPVLIGGNEEDPKLSHDAPPWIALAIHYLISLSFRSNSKPGRKICDSRNSRDRRQSVAAAGRPPQSPAWDFQKIIQLLHA